MEKLSLILWRERELLETLHYELEMEQLVLASGRTRWLMRAARQVEAVLDQLRQTEILRAVAADEAAASVGLDPDPPLRELVAAAEEPWATILGEHRDELLATTREITALADANRGLVTSGYESARETLMTLGEATDSYSPDGSAVSRSVAPRLLDRSF